ncbi:hypothetical protein HJ590_08385 [Naumannella sp. ID2617S]|nr:hypothetical protein [Naumannella sp. ID2617S]
MTSARPEATTAGPTQSRPAGYTYQETLTAHRISVGKGILALVLLAVAFAAQVLVFGTSASPSTP